MKEIFKRIEDRDWDWFGSSESGHYEINEWGELEILWAVSECDREHYGWKEFSLADLLANKSWCEAVWGDMYGYFDFTSNGTSLWLNKENNFQSEKRWIVSSNEAFKILQQQGQEACINYITKTMR